MLANNPPHQLLATILGTSISKLTEENVSEFEKSLTQEEIGSDSIKRFGDYKGYKILMVCSEASCSAIGGRGGSNEDRISFHYDSQKDKMIFITDKRKMKSIPGFSCYECNFRV